MKRLRVKTEPFPGAGFTILEMIVAMLLLGTAMAIVVPVLGWMGVESRLALQRQEAAQELHNLMDELTARPYAELTPEAAGKIELPDALKRQLPGAKLAVEITETDTSAKRIQARLSWNRQNGQALAPLRLTAWVHQREGQP
jgi:prepilin-type N-terminal cleavage/methylation domain-containing protein